MASDPLVAAILAVQIKPSDSAIWKMPAPFRVADCIISLRTKYRAFAEPRIQRFSARHPELETLRQLDGMISRAASPAAFLANEFNFRYPARAVLLSEVVRWLLPIAGDGSPADQILRLERWAESVSLADKPMIPNFGPAGFQYLRMLFGANTTKPDVHIINWVSKHVGRPLSQKEALALLEEASTRAGVRLRDLDATIWNASSASARSRRGACGA